MKYNVAPDLHDSNKPRPHEIKAAELLAEHFKSDLKFIRTGVCRTPDILVIKNKEVWELKSPTGDGKHTIKHNLYCAKGQAANVVLDLTRCKMHENKAMARIREYLRDYARSAPAKLKVIKKSQKIIDILK